MSEALSECTTLLELLQFRALGKPENPTYRFLLDGEREAVQMTNAELYERARAIAAELQNCNARGERVVLLYPPGLEFIAGFFGCLCAGVVAVPVYPPDPLRLDRTLPRLVGIIEDAQPIVALTTSGILSTLDILIELAPQLSALRWLATDAIPRDRAQEWRDPGLTPDMLAFLQYTSGSTGTPKGVMVAHQNLLHNLRLIQLSFGMVPESRVVIWLPPYHDMGLIGGILEPLYSWSTVTLMSPVDFLKRPVRWLQAISDVRGTTSGGPNFAYDMCARKITAEQRAGIDLRCWEVAFNGAEVIRHETLKRFTEAFAECGFRQEAFFPCYGLAEATLFTSGGTKSEPLRLRGLDPAAAATAADAETATVLVGCGRTLPDQRILIVDPETQLACASGQVGEIWVSGPSVAQGYWRRPQETAATFHAALRHTADGPFLRTGDLGFLTNGELFVTGRLKDLIIIRGLNHYPQDIERTVEGSHPVLRPGGAAAFGIELDGQEGLVVIAEAKRDWQGDDAGAVIGAVRRAVVEAHDLQACAISLIPAGSLPKTSSGKTQRHACRSKFLTGALEAVAEWRAPRAPETESAGAARDVVAGERASRPTPTAEAIEAWLVARVAVRLGIDSRDLDVRQPFAVFGLDSKEAVSLAADLEDWLGCPQPAVLVYEYPTIESLSRHLAMEASVLWTTTSVTLAHAEDGS